jgi:hypothetical protein
MQPMNSATEASEWSFDTAAIEVTLGAVALDASERMGVTQLFVAPSTSDATKRLLE